ncbi:MAG: hypothetical protein H6810_08535 [Phycisphaeraceae bacterium]|nr:MAG: hypothetical protein H6810_08535 [Phycisphaeraceae bacterium]
MPRSTAGRAATLAALCLGLFASSRALALPPEHMSETDWQKVRLKKYQLVEMTLGLQGYDPVAYFPEGDAKEHKGKAAKGSEKIELTYNGVVYRFITAANRDLFKEHPEKYEPAFGGWCAYAAAKEKYTKPSPKSFRIEHGRLMLFYVDLFTDTNKLWVKEGPATLEPLADAWWNKETGERPPKKPEDAEPTDKP